MIGKYSLWLTSVLVLAASAQAQSIHERVAAYVTVAFIAANITENFGRLQR